MELGRMINGLWPIANILNEVCHGIKISNIEQRIGFQTEEILKVMEKIQEYEVSNDQSDIEKIIELSDFEIDIIQKSFQVVLKHIDEWEFETRIGISVKEMNYIIEKLGL